MKYKMRFFAFFAAMVVFNLAAIFPQNGDSRKFVISMTASATPNI